MIRRAREWWGVALLVTLIVLSLSGCAEPARYDSFMAYVGPDGKVYRFDLKRWERGTERIVYGYAPEWFIIKMPGEEPERFEGTGTFTEPNKELYEGHDAPEEGAL